MTVYKFTILGEPKPKQSARFRAIKMGEKTFMKSYQKKEVLENEANIAFDIKSQLPPDFIPFDCPIGIKAIFYFPIPSNFSKKKMRELDEGKVFFKPTKPDLQDNLMKGLCDAMNKIVFIDDSRICEVRSRKVFSRKPRIEFEIYTPED